MSDRTDSAFPAITERVIGAGLVPTSDAKELHAFLTVGRDFSTWIQARLERYGFVENIDYVMVETPAQAEAFFPGSGEKSKGRPRKDYFLTLDTAKEIAMVENNEQGRVVRRYYIECERRAKAPALEASDVGGITKGVVRKALGDLVPGMLEEALTLILPKMLERQLEADARAVAVGYKPALLVLVEKKVPARRRRAFSQKVSARLRRFSADRGFGTRISRESGRWLFQVEAINAWLAYEGEQMIRDHIANHDGQGILRLVQS